jgi:hypothetical protein
VSGLGREQASVVRFLVRLERLAETLRPGPQRGPGAEVISFFGGEKKADTGPLRP